jgi:hypothetical protein
MQCSDHTIIYSKVTEMHLRETVTTNALSSRFFKA